MDKTKILKTMILRLPKYNPNRAHPIVKKIQNRMSQPPQPLTYKLYDLPQNITSPEDVLTPLGPKEDIPFRVRKKEYNY